MCGCAKSQNPGCCPPSPFPLFQLEKEGLDVSELGSRVHTFQRYFWNLPVVHGVVLAGAMRIAKSLYCFEFVPIDMDIIARRIDGDAGVLGGVEKCCYGNRCSVWSLMSRQRTLCTILVIALDPANVSILVIRGVAQREGRSYSAQERKSAGAQGCDEDKDGFGGLHG